MISDFLKNKSIFLPMLIILLSGLGMMTSDIYIVAQPEVQNYFHINKSGIQSLMSLFFAGTVTSALSAGIFSDLFGRRPFIIGALLALIITNLVISFAAPFTLVQIARFIQGLCAGTLSVLSYVVIQDCSKNPKFSRRYFSYIGMILIFIPIISHLYWRIYSRYFWVESHFLFFTNFVNFSIFNIVPLF